MQTLADPGTSGDFLTLTRATPSHAQRLIALKILPAILVVVFGLAKPFANVPLHPIDAFVPFFVTALFLNDLITASLLFAQFALLRTRAMLVIASGYLFAAVMLVPYTLSFPGVFMSGSMVGNLQSTPWLYILRHLGIGLFLSAFAVSDSNVQVPRPQKGTRRSIGFAALATIATVFVVGLVCISGRTILPIVTVNRFEFADNWVLYAGLPMGSAYFLAMILLWFRRDTILGLWLMVVAFVNLFGVFLGNYPNPARFSVGWYTVIGINLVAHTLVLVVLLVEFSKLYSRVLQAVHAQHREREARLITGDAVAAMISHDVKQPLSAMITRAEACLRRLDRAIPDVEKAREDVKQVAADGHRAAGVIDSIRANFKKEARARKVFDFNGLVQETIVLMRDDIQRHGVVVDGAQDVGPVLVEGDRTQLQQVLLNLCTNAIDAMAGEDNARILSIRSEIRDRNEVVVSVADTGKGISPQDAERIFNPLFSTKTGGMGMGLSICRSIIEAHDGRISVIRDQRKGAVFRFALPVALATLTGQNV